MFFASRYKRVTVLAALFESKFVTSTLVDVVTDCVPFNQGITPNRCSNSLTTNWNRHQMTSRGRDCPQESRVIVQLTQSQGET